MGRKRKNFDKMSAGFSLGTFERMDAVLPRLYLVPHLFKPTR
jgi:hypothetical protein